MSENLKKKKKERPLSNNLETLNGTIGTYHAFSCKKKYPLLVGRQVLQLRYVSSVPALTIADRGT